MVVKREREIRSFVKTPFYRVLAQVALGEEKGVFEAEWRALEGSKYFKSPILYKENGFKKKEDAEKLIHELSEEKPILTEVFSVERKKENKNAPLLYNLAELQNECSKLFKISPDQTLNIVQELYEKKLVTYPRTDARVLSTAVAKEIQKNIKGLLSYPNGAVFAKEILDKESQKGIEKTRYVNDKQITDHYAIIPTGQGLNVLSSLNGNSVCVYETIVRRFLSIFYPPAVYQKITVITKTKNEAFYASFKVLLEEGYLKVAGKSSVSVSKKEEKDNVEDVKCDSKMLEALGKLKKGMILQINELNIKEGETSPPKRYNSGSMILAMENAGQLIEDEELRAQIKGSGIGTSATRAEILKKLLHNGYMELNKKTQIITPSLLGEMIYEVVNASIKQLLNPELTASWEKGLTYVAEGNITSEEYMEKLERFVKSRTQSVAGLNNQCVLRACFEKAAESYKEKNEKKKKEKENL